ncbi:MAG: hypothetical protein M0T74_04225, partial [Desulfitobacterium hafniense]|nr:hypothetical protein [Desulfitobacterium hafniense]
SDLLQYLAVCIRLRAVAIFPFPCRSVFPTSIPPLSGLTLACVDFSRKAEPGNLGVQAIYLISGYGSGINNLGGGTVSITGYTDTYSTVSSVTVTLYLQKWDGSQWVDLTGQSYTSYSTASVTGTKYIAVAGGAYYRTRALHNAKNGSTTDSSSYIYVP